MVELEKKKAKQFRQKLFSGIHLLKLFFFPSRQKYIKLTFIFSSFPFPFSSLKESSSADVLCELSSRKQLPFDGFSFCSLTDSLADLVAVCLHAACVCVAAVTVTDCFLAAAVFAASSANRCPGIPVPCCHCVDILLTDFFDTRINFEGDLYSSRSSRSQFCFICNYFI